MYGKFLGILIFRKAHKVIVPLKKPLPFSGRGWGGAKISQLIPIWAFPLIFFAVGSLAVQAQYAFDEPITKAYKEISLLKIESATKILGQYHSISKATNGCALLVANYADFAILMLTEDAVLLQKLLPNKDLRLDALKKYNKKSPYYRYIKAEILFQWGLINLKAGNELDAAVDLLKAYNLLVDNKKEFPDFAYHYKTLGLFHLILGNIPDKYKYIVQMFGFEINSELGLAELNKASAANTIFGTEILYLFCLSEQYLFHSQTHLSQLETIVKSQPQNVLAGYLYASILSKTNNAIEALAVLSVLKPAENSLNFPYLHYLLGSLLLQKGEFANAQIEFRKFLSSFKGQNYRKDTYYKLSLAASMLGDTLLAHTYRDSVLLFGMAELESDKHAMYKCVNYYQTDIRLIAAMLKFDGGYLQEASAILAQIMPDELRLTQDKTEFLYRKARILHKQKMDKNASMYYLQAIDSQKDKNYYYAPNSCLQLGYIYANLQPTKAIEYFKKVFEYSGYEYENGIKGKAKNAIKKLQN